jgi:hypothetical protein
LSATAQKGRQSTIGGDRPKIAFLVLVHLGHTGTATFSFRVSGVLSGLRAMLIACVVFDVTPRDAFAATITD